MRTRAQHIYKEPETQTQGIEQSFNHSESGLATSTEGSVLCDAVNVLFSAQQLAAINALSIFKYVSTVDDSRTDESVDKTFRM